jgi:hypothetical protein
VRFTDENDSKQSYDMFRLLLDNAEHFRFPYILNEID